MEEEIKIVVLGKDIPVKFRNFSFKDIEVILNLSPILKWQKNDHGILKAGLTDGIETSIYGS